jgi:tRNA (guanine37-N1)-methyltransferase
LRVRLKERLADTLTAPQLSIIYNGFDIVGDVAVIRTRGGDIQNAQAAAKQIMATHKGIKTVLRQTSAVEGEHRTRKLEVLAGEHKTAAKHKEAGCIFTVDLEKCYFSPRLNYERLRIASQVSPEETVVNMFSGVGCFSIIIAKAAPQSKVYSIDVNPAAYDAMVENVRVNRVYRRVMPLLGDAKQLVETQLRGVADRVLMPLPELAIEYLPAAVTALKREGGWIHLYDFEHAPNKENPAEKTERKVAAELDSLGVRYMFAYSRVVRSTGPNWYQTVLDLEVLGS